MYYFIQQYVYSTKFQTDLGTGNTAVSNTVKCYPQSPNILMRQGRQQGKKHSCSMSDRAVSVPTVPFMCFHLLFSLCPFHSFTQEVIIVHLLWERHYFRPQACCSNHEGQSIGWDMGTPAINKYILNSMSLDNKYSEERESMVIDIRHAGMSAGCSFIMDGQGRPSK